MSAEFPRTPADVPDSTYGEMVDAFTAYLRPLVDAHHGTGTPLPGVELARHAVAALATQHAVAERILSTRWVTARDALVYGATITAVAAGMGLDIDEVLMGLRSWAVGQHREHLMSAALRDEVLALVDTAEQTGGDR